MSAKQKKASPKGTRYTDAQKQSVVEFVKQYDAKNGRGGQAAAVRKYGITALTISGWLKGAKGAAASKAAPAKKAAKKAVAKTAAKKAPRAAKFSKGKAPQGIRYTPEQKKAVVDFILDYNKANGRGGMSAAAKKFNITPLTVSVWVTRSGKAPTAAETKLKAQLADALATIKELKAKPGRK